MGVGPLLGRPMKESVKKPSLIDRTLARRRGQKEERTRTEKEEEEEEEVEEEEEERASQTRMIRKEVGREEEGSKVKSRMKSKLVVDGWIMQSCAATNPTANGVDGGSSKARRGRRERERKRGL